MQLTICGVDAGKNTAVAVLGMDGKLLHLESFKNKKYEELARVISTYGKTLIVATDVNPPPKTVRKIASSLNSKLFYPTKQFKKKQKYNVTQAYNEIISNSHERDALASAMKAYKKYTGLIMKIERFVGYSDKEYKEEIIYDIIRHLYPNIKSALGKTKVINNNQQINS
ncbi:MAG: DUF460 domain-containing protein [Nanoarchaeota archaeon]|nr:DUF460 domain-containing protein [Nanoarchaeota archaeon]